LFICQGLFAKICIEKLSEVCDRKACTPKHLEYKSGGPPVTELTMTLSELREELAGSELVHALETERSVIEGRLHHGHAAVVQILTVKP
jgi:hypothetical protein